MMTEKTVHAKKQFGQNFLIGDAIPSRIASESGIDEHTGVIEIGPGLGILTNQLASRAGKVVAVEIDRELIPVLRERFALNENVQIVEGDIMKTDLRQIISEEFPGLRVAVVANLPYYITSPVIWKLVEGRYGFSSITVMVQKEVAERLSSKPGSSEYGAMTVSLSYYAEIRKLFNVSAGNFRPRPKVDSAVIQLIPHATPPVFVRDEGMLFDCIRASFSMRRKSLSNGLSSGLQISKSDAAAAIAACGFEEKVRGEDLSLSDFARLSNELQVIRNPLDE